MMETNVERERKSAEEAVRELEERLAALSSASTPATTETENEEPDLLNFERIDAPPVATTATQSGQVKGGKNALLARIMAAQEKAKPAINPTISAQTSDLFVPPPQLKEAPPPVYNTNLLSAPPLQNIALPPAFDAVENSMKSQVEAPAYSASAPPQPPAASAPAFEDLLGNQQTPLPPPVQVISPEEEMIMGMEGLSPEERRTLLEEQRKIMDQIEREKNDNKAAIAAAQADNFNMRSTSSAITAVVSRAETGQVDLDRQMAEKLQNEEYLQADAATSERTVRQTPQSAAPAEEASWWDSVTGMFSANASNTPGALGVSEGHSSNERESLNRRPAGAPPAARVAQSKPLFACVVDSVNSTVGTLTGSAPDSQGNVHGVDSSSLLAMSNVGRENPNTSYTAYNS